MLTSSSICRTALTSDDIPSSMQVIYNSTTATLTAHFHCLFSDSSFVCVPSSLCVHCQYMSPVHLQSHTVSCISQCLFSDSLFVCVPSSLCVHCQYMSPVSLQSHTVSCISQCLFSDSLFVCFPTSLCVHCHYVLCSLSFTHCTAYMH